MSTRRDRADEERKKKGTEYTEKGRRRRSEKGLPIHACPHRCPTEYTRCEHVRRHHDSKHPECTINHPELRPVSHRLSDVGSPGGVDPGESSVGSNSPDALISIPYHSVGQRTAEAANSPPATHWGYPNAPLAPYNPQSTSQFSSMSNIVPNTVPNTTHLSGAQFNRSPQQYGSSRSRGDSTAPYSSVDPAARSLSSRPSAMYSHGGHGANVPTMTTANTHMENEMNGIISTYSPFSQNLGYSTALEPVSMPHDNTHLQTGPYLTQPGLHANVGMSQPGEPRMFSSGLSHDAYASQPLYSSYGSQPNGPTSTSGNPNVHYSTAFNHGFEQ